jgi:hypothetical protein
MIGPFFVHWRKRVGAAWGLCRAYALRENCSVVFRLRLQLRG